jgi:DNA polymerase-2
MEEVVHTGWLFDVYPLPGGIRLWIIDTSGEKHAAFAPFAPSFFMHIPRSDEQRVAALVNSFPCRVTLDWVVRRELYSNEEWTVLRVQVHDPLRLKEVVRRLEHHFPHFVFFNSDIPPQQIYLYDTGLFPLAYGEYVLAADGTLRAVHLADRRDAIEYSMPPLTFLKLTNRPDVLSPKYRKTLQLEISYNDQTYILQQDHPADVLASVNDHLRRCDPDVIMTEYGDALLLPTLERLSEEHRVPLLLNRDVHAGYFRTRESSYVVYGKMVHKEGAFELAGRWHLDTENSFMMGEASLDGVVEIARLTQLPVQHQARSSIGTALSSMQLSWAYRNNYLIPAKKREPESFKSAATLLLADRGGLIFQPIMGYHEQIAELDFVSMYPSIMVEHNVSPETVNCRCCRNEAVPELRYTICEKREGIVPATLRPLVERRSFYKKEKRRLKKLGDERWHLYDRRQNALKWMLVTCFGYLGYKNARFGKIEAHEAVNAFSRESILRAKELAEARGYRFLHAIVDCMWLKKDGATEADYERLCGEIKELTGIEISLEGIYNWILFPSSKMDPNMPTANRYVGFYTTGEIKVRGIELRRRDTPVFIKRMQGKMLEVFQHARSVAEVEACVPAALAVAREYIALLASGKADPLELVIRQHLSQEADEYTTNSANAVAAKAMEEAGIALRPGEMLEYIIVDSTGKKKPAKAVALPLYSLEDGYDIDKYTALALKAIATLLLPFGYSTNKLEEIFGLPEKRRARHRDRRSAQQAFDSQTHTK